jgi:predicted sulfurtransferase
MRETEAPMTGVFALITLLLLPTIAMAQQNPSASGQPAPAPPNAPKMASDDVLALVEKGDVFFLDVREPKELADLGTFEGYVNIPLGQIEKRLAEIPRDKAIITA